MSENRDDFTRIRVPQSLFEAQRVEAILDEASIESWLVPYHDSAMDGLYQMQKGWGEVRVPDSQKDDARKILAERMPMTVGITEEELAKQALDAPGVHEPADRPRGGHVNWDVTGILFACLAALVGYVFWKVSGEGSWHDLDLFQWIVLAVLAVYGLVMFYLLARWRPRA
ncbi:MAG TPA: DUF2007 domain-containing protein [Myxococcota bacterium]|nr:DUF2007 domain-containing protein [Myxococcota bacterium]